MSPEDVEATALLQTILSRAAQLCEVAGNRQAARKLALCPVRLDDRLGCVFRFTREVEQVMLAKWARAPLTPSSAGCALEAVTLARTAAIGVLAQIRRKPVLEWLRVVERRLRYMLACAGVEPSGTIMGRRAELLEALEEEEDAQEA